MFDYHYEEELPEEKDKADVILTKGSLSLGGEAPRPVLCADKYNTHVLCVFHMQLPKKHFYGVPATPATTIFYVPEQPAFRIIFLPPQFGGGSAIMMFDGFRAQDMIPVRAIIKEGK